MVKRDLVVPWFGFDLVRNNVAETLEDHFQIEVDRGKINISQCLEAIAETEYPLILVNDVVPFSYLRLPNGVDNDPFKVSRYLIKTIKSSGQNSMTPIIATVMMSNGGDEELYGENGAGPDYVYDFGNTEGLIRMVGHFLHKK
jgi:hypothetical protein